MNRDTLFEVIQKLFDSNVDFTINIRVNHKSNDRVKIDVVPEKSHKSDFEEIMDNLLRALCASESLVGYTYIKEALRIMRNETSAKRDITNKVYTSLAEKFDTTYSSVERGIRHSIVRIFEGQGAEKAKDMFNHVIAKGKSKPTNSEFLAVMLKNINKKMT